MPIYSSLGIQNSVGRNGRNQSYDVSAVQERLNELMNAPRKPLVVDSICGNKTKSMIRDFQLNVVGFRWPDSRVDPAGKTIVALNDPASESTWARMSIPPAPKGGGGKEPFDTPKKPWDAVDAAIENLKMTQSLTPSEEARMRVLFKKLWETQKGGVPVIPATGMPEDELAKWFTVTKLSYSAVTKVFVIASWSVEALAASAIAMSAISVVLMAVGFVFALNKAMTSHYRVYGCIAQAYYIVWWAHGGRKPTESQERLDRLKAGLNEGEYDRSRLDQAWREGQIAAQEGIEKSVRDVAAKAGLTHAEARETLRAFLRMEKKTDLAKGIIKQIADEIEFKDVQVANALSSEAKSYMWHYPN